MKIQTSRRFSHIASGNHSLHRLRPYHARTYRKRHIVSLSLFTLLTFVLVAQLIWLLVITYQLRYNAVKTLSSNVLITPSPDPHSVTLAPGYKFQFNASAFEIEATETLADGSQKTAITNQIDSNRRYSTVELQPSLETIGRLKGIDNSKLTITASTNLEPKSSADFDVNKESETTEIINGITFLKQVFLSTPKNPLKGNLELKPIKTQILIAQSTDKILTIRISGIIEGVTPLGLYEEVIETIELSANQQTSVSDTNSKLGWQEHLLNIFSQPASAADSQTTDTSQLRIIASYTPAVVKVYQVYCGDFVYLKVTLGEVCAATSGSGFILSSDGYIATNGHVVSGSAKEAAVQNISQSPDLLIAMLRAEGYTERQINAFIQNVQSDPDTLSSVISAIYALAKEDIYLANEQHFYTVALGKDVPDLKTIIDSKRASSDSQAIKNAELVAIDYNFDDLLTEKFTQSDVAILKVTGRDFPVVRLGSVDRVITGMSLTVIGFPGAAENSLTDNSTLKATATNGLVSAVRNTNGNGKRIVQSNADIGHGNSGGPAFDSDGNVFGIATYIFTTESAGDPTLSYMRDIDDLLDLAEIKNINFNTESDTQKLWEEGLDEFFKARYSKAIIKFDQVRELYPAHSLASEYIKTAQAKIANGEEAPDPTIAWVLGVSIIISIVGSATTVFVIMRHHARHNLYKAAQNGTLSHPLVTKLELNRLHAHHQK
jgi:S1-C subfamily serine protease